MSSSVSRVLFPFCILFGFIQGNILAQVIGEDVCACSPPTYKFTLDFSLSCPPTNITLGEGVASEDCLIRPLLNPAVTDLVPVSVTKIDIFEFGQDVTLIVSESIDGDFLQGDVFDYESITFTPESITSTQDIPKVFQISLRGKNIDGEDIINIFIITMTNRCDAYPLFDIGASAGWVVFSELGIPDESVCPIAANTTLSPVDSPVSAAPIPVPPVSMAPVTESPVSLSPVTDAPATVSPITSTPTTSAPATSAPITAAPTPMTSAPTTSSPGTMAPATDVPASSAPITSTPGTFPPSVTPATASPVSIAPSTNSPVSPTPIPAVPTSTPSTASPQTESPTATPSLRATTRRPSASPTRLPVPTAVPTLAPSGMSMSMSMSMNLRGLQELDDLLDNEFGNIIRM